MEGNTPYLVVNGLKKHYGNDEARVQVLDGITTTINKGEICVMLGPSGSGKSTFLNLIGGLEGADGGTIRVGDCEITALSAKNLGEYRRRELGFVFQFYNLIPDLTVQENIQVVADIAKSPLDIDEVMDSLGIAQYKNRFPKELSGGQQQRVAIARALIKNPKILLCDELTGALDSKSSRAVLKVIEKVNTSFKTTIIIITHNEAIAHMADTIVRIRDGKVADCINNKERVAADELEL